MDALDYWRLCDELSVVQAILLLAGEEDEAAQMELPIPPTILSIERGRSLTKGKHSDGDCFASTASKLKSPLKRR
jgi:hypothetical protein